MAGLAAYTLSELIMLDNSSPRQPTLSACHHSGRLGADGVFYQPDESGFTICWEAPGFVDVESGVQTLEWQLAR